MGSFINDLIISNISAKLVGAGFVDAPPGEQGLDFPRRVFGLLVGVGGGREVAVISSSRLSDIGSLG